MALAPYVEYFLDAAVEAVELDACTAMTLRLYGDNDVLQPLIDRPARAGRTIWKDRLAKNMALVPIANSILEQLPLQRRAGLIYHGARGMIYEIESVAECFSGWAIGDSVEGGCLLPFRNRIRARNKVVFRRTERRLCSPRFIRRYVKSHAHEAAHLAELVKVNMRRWQSLPPGSLRHDPSLWAEYRRTIHTTPPVVRSSARKIAVSERRVIRRSLRTAIGILGQETVSAFVRGEPIKINGSTTMLILQKRGRLADRGHGCLSVGMADREGRTLAELCTYVEDTPTLDQLSAFGLWMKAGEEREVLKTANIVHLTADGERHPLLIEKRQNRGEERVAALAELIRSVGEDQANEIVRIIERPHRKAWMSEWSYEERRARDRDYWERTKDIWIDAMMVLLLGRDHTIRRVREA